MSRKMNTKVILILVLLSLLTAFFTGVIIYEAVSWSKLDSGGGPSKLEAPVLSLDGNRVSWNPLANAEKYEASLNGFLSYIDDTLTEINLTDGQTFKLRAIGDGREYLTSEWSNTVSYSAPTPEKLPVPSVSVGTDGIAVWNTVVGAIGYACKIDGGLEFSTSDTSLLLLPMQRISVKAVGDGINNLDSDYSEEKSYIPPEPIKLETPVLNISEDGVASWNAVDGADAYVYLINGILESRTESTSVRLSSGMTIRVKAVSDSYAYTDSDYSEEKSYIATAPTPTPDPTPDQGPTTEPDPEPALPKLLTPCVTISEDGTASWTEVAGAVKYIYRIDGGEETEAVMTTVLLSYCQSITVKACGDGENYADSDYSPELTYIPPSPDVIEFAVSEKIPGEAESGILPESSSIAEEDYKRLLKEYFKDSENHLGKYPSESGYAFYAKPNDTLYLSVLLDNPRQYEILSLEFNGVKYTLGNNLFALNVEKDGKNLTCVYAQITVPRGAYEEFSYTVSNIEYLESIYVEESKLNNRDTLKIGLPYQENAYTVSGFSFENIGIRSVDYKFTINGSEDFLAKTDGWLGFMIYHGSEIAYNGIVDIGENSVSASGLLEDSEYISVIYLYADLHDGLGVTAHLLYYSTVITEPAISFEYLECGMKYNEDEKRYYPEISVKAVLYSDSAHYLKLELCDKDGKVFYTDFYFSGQAKISGGILNGADTTVRIYYSDNEYPQGRSIERTVYVYALGDISLYDSSYKSSEDNVIYRFRLGSPSGSYPYVKEVRFLMYDKSDSAYIAESILQIMDNSNAINIAHSKYQAALIDLERVDKYLETEEYLRLEKIAKAYEAEWLELKAAKEIFDEYYSDKTDREFWESELREGKYIYEIVYDGENTDSFSRAFDEYLVTLRDYYSLDSSKEYFIKVVATVDKNDGEEPYDVDFGEMIANFQKNES